MLNTDPFNEVTFNFAFLIAVLFVGAYNLVQGVVSLCSLETYGSASFRMFQFQASGGLSHAALVESVQFLQGNCAVPSGLSIINGTAAAVYAVPITVNGLLLNWQNASQTSLGAGEFSILGSNDGVQWALLGSSNYRFLRSGVRFLRGPADTPTRTKFEYRPPWPLVVDMWSQARGSTVPHVTP